MKKGRLIAGIVTGVLSLACFTFATLFLFGALADANASDNAGAAIALVLVIYVALIVYGAQALTGIISLVCTGGCFRSESKTVRLLAIISFAVVLALLLAAVIVVVYLFTRG